MVYFLLIMYYNMKSVNYIVTFNIVVGFNFDKIYVNAFVVSLDNN